MSSLFKLFMSLMLAVSCMSAFAKEPCSVAVLPFTERGPGVANMGAQAADLIYVELLKNPDIFMVERAELEKIMAELHLNASGMVSENQSVKIGEMCGAKILVTGSIFKTENKTMIIGKVISTETSLTQGCSAEGTDGIQALSARLSKDLSNILSTKLEGILPKIKKDKDIIEELKGKVGDVKKIKLFIKISESHIGQQSIDPAAQTEMELICKELGFDLVTSETDADILIKGEGFSEFASRRGDMVSVRARLEVKATDKNGKIIVSDRQTAINVGLAENITGKSALQKASAQIAERIIPKIAKKK